MLANLASPLLGMVDTAVLGHSSNPMYLSAMGLSVSLFTYILWGFNFLSISCCTFTAQAFSAQQTDKVAVILLQYLGIACLLSLLVLILSYLIVPFIIELSVKQAQIQQMVQTYLNIRLLAIPAIFCLQVSIAWFAGLQSPKVALYVLFCSFCINTFLDIILVFYFHLDLQGVAIASVVAEYSALIMVLFLAIRRIQIPVLHWRPLIKKRHLMIARQQVIAVSRDLFSRSWVLLSVFVLFNALSLQHSPHIAAANTVLLLLIVLSSSVLDGFADSAQIQIASVRNNKQLIGIIKASAGLSIGCALLLTLIYYIGFEYFVQIITRDLNTQQLAKTYQYWIILLPITSFASYWLDGIFAGLNASKTMRNTVFINFFALYLPCLLLIGQLNNHLLWLSLHLFMLGRSIYMLIALRQFLLKRADGK